MEKIKTDKLRNLGNGKSIYLNKYMLLNLGLEEDEDIYIDYSEPGRIIVGKAKDYIDDEEIFELSQNLF